jgi:hypothetical protein
MLLFVAAAGCDASRSARLDRTALECWSRDQAICSVLNSIGNRLTEPTAKELRLPDAEQVALDVAAILGGMQRRGELATAYPRHTVP